MINNISNIIINNEKYIQKMMSKINSSTSIKLTTFLNTLISNIFPISAEKNEGNIEKESNDFAVKESNGKLVFSNEIIQNDRQSFRNNNIGKKKSNNDNEIKIVGDKIFDCLTKIYSIARNLKKNSYNENHRNLLLKFASQHIELMNQKNIISKKEILRNKSSNNPKKEMITMKKEIFEIKEQIVVKMRRIQMIMKKLKSPNVDDNLYGKLIIDILFSISKLTENENLLKMKTHMLQRIIPNNFISKY